MAPARARAAPPARRESDESREAFAEQAAHVADQLVALLDQYPDTVQGCGPEAGVTLRSCASTLRSMVRADVLEGAGDVTARHASSRVVTR